MKIKNIVFILFLLIIFDSGCRKGFFDTRVDTQITQKALETNNATLWGFATRMYAPIQSGFYLLDNNLAAGMTDDAQQTSVSGDVYYYTRGIISPDANPLGYLYGYYYEGIRAANFFLDYSKKHGEEIILFGADTVRAITNYHRDLQRLKWYQAEAYIAKAYYYGELIKMYGGVPIVTTTREDDPNPGKLTRSSYNEVVQYIINLIDNHINDLNDNWKNSSVNGNLNANQYGRFTPLIAMAIKARVLLYAASPLNNPDNDITKWEKAASAANDVIRYMNYSIPENRDYRSFFEGNNPVQSNGVIWTFKQPSDNQPEKNNYPINTIGGNSGITPTQNLVSEYEYIGSHDPNDRYANRDPRLKATIVVNGSNWNGREIDEAPGGTDDMSKSNTSRTGYYLKKYLAESLNLDRGENAQHQWIIFRYAEILLNYAEAMNEAYGPDDLPSGYAMTARQALMEVRNSASTLLPPVTTLDKDKFRKKVHHERRIELAFEGHRYWDLLRWKEAKDVLNRPIKGMKVTKDAFGHFHYQITNVANRKFLDKNYRFPFARREIVKSNGTLTQNTGY